MDLANLLLESENRRAVKQLAVGLGVSEEDARAAVAGMMPVISDGLRSQIFNPDGLRTLVELLDTGSHRRYLEQPGSLTEADAIAEGKVLVEHLLGSEAKSRRLAADVAASTRLDADLLGNILPLVALMFMGNLSKQAFPASQPNRQEHGPGPLGDRLDANKDSSAISDMMKLAGKYMR